MKRAAFSLVEVAMALGLLSFVLLSIMGLLGVGLNSSRSAHLDTIQASMARQVLSAVRADTAGPNFDSFTQDQWYFTLDGTLLTNSADAYFECRITVDEVDNAPEDARPHLRILQMEFVHPVAAPPQSRTTNTVQTTLARHD